MIKPLRNAHRQTWLMLAFLLPAGIIAAWLVIPASDPVTVLSRPSSGLLPAIQARRESLQHCVYVRSSLDKKNWQIEWKNNTPLAVPSAVIYQLKGKQTSIDKARLVGRIEATGRYVFTLHPDSGRLKELNLVLYDFIHEKLIDSFNFKINQ